MCEEKNAKRGDLFDRLFHMPPLRKYEPWLKAHREGILYLLFGGLTTLVSWLVFFVFEGPLGLDATFIANPISWVLAVAFAYLTNRTWVFKSRTSGALPLFLEVLSFYASRVITFLFEEGVLLLFVTLLSLPALPIKIAASVLVVLLNYVFSKLFVFRRKKEETGEKQDEDGSL